MYRSEAVLEGFCTRMSQAALKILPDDELILVNDGSPDNCLQKALELAAHDPRIAVVDLSRNFGHHAAIVAGFEQAAVI